MKKPLDRIDIALIRALQKDGQTPTKELAAIAGLAPSSTHARLRALRSDGILTGIHARVDPSSLGIGLQAFVFLRLAVHSRCAIRTVWEAVCALPEVIAAYYVGGDDDIVLHVAVPDTQHLRDLVLDQIQLQDQIARVRTELLFEAYRADVLPVFAEADG